MLLLAYGNEVVCKRIPLNILGLGRATLLISYLSNGSLSARNYLSMKSIAVIIRTALLLRAGYSKEETPESTEPVKLRSMAMTRVPFIEEGYVCTEMSKLNAQSFISVLSLLIRRQLRCGKSCRIRSQLRKYSLLCRRDCKREIEIRA